MQLPICPITQLPMDDPVIASDGHTYERKAIQAWFDQGNETSPITNLKLKDLVLIPNYALRSLIDDHQSKQNQSKQNQSKQNQSNQNQSKQEKSTTGIRATVQSLNMDQSLVTLTCLNQYPNNIPLTRLNIICILDISGSMNESSQPYSSNLKETIQFSRISLVKHSMKMIVQSLFESKIDHQFSIITFSCTSKVMYNKKQIQSEQECFTVCDEIDGITCAGGTNIMSGISMAFDILKQSNSCYQNHVLLFTDGEPTPSYAPPFGYLNEFDRLSKEKAKHLKFSFHTCGFGYQLDTKLLVDFANLGSGGYYYIPEISMSGTIFINFISNLFNSYRNDICVNGVRIGTLSRTQPRYIVVPQQKIQITIGNNGGEEEEIIPLHIQPDNNTIPEWLQDRETLIQTLEMIIATKSRNHVWGEDLHQGVVFVSKIKDSFYTDYEHEDSNRGQITKAIPFWNTWGKNYLYSILLSHKREEYANFKDEAMKLYLNDTLKEWITRGNDIFQNIKPPKPMPVYDARTCSYQSINVSISQFNQATNDENGSCFSGDSLVTMRDGTQKKIKDCSVGDVLLNHAVIDMILVFHSPTIVLQLSEHCGITPYHPILIDNEWQFPIEAFPFAGMKQVDTVYNMILNHTHHIEMDQTFICCTLGHGLRNNEVIDHDFFGNRSRIEENLGMNHGVVHLSGKVVRGKHGRVVGFVHNQFHLQSSL